MIEDFRFMVVCGHAARDAEGVATLEHVVNTIGGSRDDGVELTVVLGLVMTPAMQGKSLVLIPQRFDPPEWEIVSASGKRGTPLSLPEERGPVILPYPDILPTPRSGLYRYQLVDRDGVIGPSMSVLATYTFGVNVTDPV